MITRLLPVFTRTTISMDSTSQIVRIRAHCCVNVCCENFLWCRISRIDVVCGLWFVVRDLARKLSSFFSFFLFSFLHFWFQNTISILSVILFQKSSYKKGSLVRYFYSFESFKNWNIIYDSLSVKRFVFNSMFLLLFAFIRFHRRWIVLTIIPVASDACFNVAPAFSISIAEQTCTSNLSGESILFGRVFKRLNALLVAVGVISLFLPGSSCGLREIFFFFFGLQGVFSCIEFTPRPYSSTTLSLCALKELSNLWNKE